MCSIMGYCGSGAAFGRLEEAFYRSKERGPDDTHVVNTGKGWLGFHRLAIMGLTPEGMQPFALGNSYVVCNGEIYGFEKLKESLADKYTFVSGSDCEVLLPMYREYGVDMFKMLDAEFACILYDGDTGEYIAARDPIGIRPLFYGYDESGAIVFASEARNLMGLVPKVCPFPPGHYYKDGKFVCYADMTHVETPVEDSLEDIFRNIREKLVAGVEKRLVSDAKVGFLLSGGLDSSLVCAIAARQSKKPIRTFSIGMEGDAIDLKYARQAADYLGSEHTEVIITREDVLKALPHVVEILGTYDITTIRAVSACIWCVRPFTKIPMSACCSPAKFPMSCLDINIPTLPPAPKLSRRNRKSASGSFIAMMFCGPTAAFLTILWKPVCPLAIWILFGM